MTLICHRGNLSGKALDRENHPDTIRNCIALGYDVEIDIRNINNELWLGHDNPQYRVTIEWIIKYANKLWIHCKNLEALWYFNQHPDWKYNYFWHDTDEYTLTSKGNIWANVGKPLTNNSIMVMPELADPSLFNAYTATCLGICSDYIQDIKRIRDEISSIR